MVESRALPPGFDRLLVVLSDVEMGAGGPQDDCPHSASVAELLLQYSEAHPRRPIDFVFNGDTFDFLKTSVDGSYPRHISESIALKKLQRITHAHRPFFDGLRRVLDREDRTISFVAGNHDLELFFPRVQEEIRRLVGRKAGFPGISYEQGNVLVEHGSQGDPMFRIDSNNVFIEHDGETILNLPWGAVGVIDAVLPYHDELHLLDRIRPKDALFEALPEARELLVQLAKRYWLGEYWHDLLVARDPLKQPSWEIIKEVAVRMVSTDADVTFGRHYVEALEADEAHDVLVVGHEHVAKEVGLTDKVLLATSCLRNEYVLERRSEALTPCRKHVAEIRMRDGRAVDARLAPVEMPCELPGNLDGLRPVVLRCLETLAPAPDVLSAVAVAATRFRSARRRR